MSRVKVGSSHSDVSPVRYMQVSTADMSVGLSKGQAKHLGEAGFDVSLVSSPGPKLFAAAEDEGVDVYSVPMAREVSLHRDVVSLWRLWRLMRLVRPTVTNVGTPKAGLLGGLASWLNQVPCRIYTLRGLRSETCIGWKRRYLVVVERIACGCAHRVICVSPSLREKVVALGIANPDRAVVLASGSSNGVDVDRFAPTPERFQQARILRDELNIPQDAPVVGFVGRFTRDKGICELVEAFLQLQHRHPDIYLLLVGDFEEGDPIPAETCDAISGNSQVIRTGMVQDAVPYYFVMNVLALPTYREGFPNAVLEAQAAARPTVTTFATGARDAIQDGITGILVPVGDSASLNTAIALFIENPDKALAMGKAGKERVAREFRREILWNALEREVRFLLQEQGLLLPRPIRDEEKARRTFRKQSRRVSRVIKRVFDVVVSTLTLLLLMPLLACLAVAVRLTMGGPVLFRQIRPGYRAKPFTLLKLRTMTSACDSRGNPLSDEKRLTRLGRMLRRFSLDEIPQLWNVWKGEMSLVGPRPLLMHYLGRYSAEQARRHDVTPGITGWAQVHGRNALSWEERFRLDVWYVDHWSLGLDARIILKTFRKVLQREGISQSGHATMPEFQGSNQAGC
jgi:lipopolysaccharide/colanic/teichoic acid biosynthesis glycosyltransferase/glycosyltransferase involved in cell wall biosynthesis